MYIELEGKRLAAVEGYEEKISFDSSYIEAIGETEPIAVIKGKARYEIAISKIYLCESEIDIEKVYNFDLVIVKNNKKITYSGCQIKDLKQHSSDKSIVENITLMASKREESV